MKNSVDGKRSQKFASTVFFGLRTNEPSSLITRKPNEIATIASLKENLASLLGVLYEYIQKKVSNLLYCFKQLLQELRKLSNLCWQAFRSLTYLLISGSVYISPVSQAF